MHQNDFCQDFDLIEFVKQNPYQIDPFSIERKDFTVKFLAAGVLQFTPKKSSRRYLVLSAGVHGNETAPIEIVSSIVSDILSKQLSLDINLLVIIGNPKAMKIEQRFSEINLNRLFNGEWQNFLIDGGLAEKNYEPLRAKEIEYFVDQFYQQSEQGHERFHYDLHTAIRASKYEKFAIYPHLHERKHSQEQLNFLADCGVETALLYHKPSTTFSYHTSFNYKAHGFTVELGKVKPFGENNMDDFSAAGKCLRKLINNSYQFDGNPHKYSLNLFRIKKELLKISEQSRLNITDDTANFTSFDSGYELLIDPEQSYQVQKNGEAIVFPNNNVPIGQRMALIVEPLS
ncbi:MAG: succinylglutamate desuccinylase [Kangiellaceae bacterium]|nr:succinylglutamate desuccinylase [Kangiellaceae bacterium]